MHKQSKKKQDTKPGYADGDNLSKMQNEQIIKKRLLGGVWFIALSPKYMGYLLIQ